MNAISISIFNNKGGVGKTTFLFHIAYLLAEKGYKVLMVDCDSQCNLTAYSMSETEIERAWLPNGNSIYQQIAPVFRGIGDIRDRKPTRIDNNLYILPGDLSLSFFEDRLGDTWNGAKGGSEPDIRAQSAIYRVINNTILKAEAEIVLIDSGPNLGALNRAVISGTDYIIVPVAPDLFSIRGTKNLGEKLKVWREEWDMCHQAWRNSTFKMPQGKPKFLGYVVQQHNIRNNVTGMTKGWEIFGKDIENAVTQNIIQQLKPLDQVVSSTDYNLGKIPNFHSLIPYSMQAKKPIFLCTAQDGLKGNHISKAKESKGLFAPFVTEILRVVPPL